VRSQARFPGVGREPGHYESFYIKATRPTGGQGIRLRQTVHKRSGEEPRGAIWLTLFDADAPGPRAANAGFAAAELSAPRGAYIQVNGALLEPGHAAGRLATAQLEASWELSFDDASEPFHHLPFERPYGAPLPRTKLLSPYPSARFDGTLTVGEEQLDLAGWPGMIGHNWGTRARRTLGLDPGGRAGRAGGAATWTSPPPGSRWAP